MYLERLEFVLYRHVLRQIHEFVLYIHVLRKTLEFVLEGRRTNSHTHTQYHSQSK